MAWTTATTRSSGYLVTAAVWNAEHVDNMNWLKEISHTTFTANVTVSATTEATANTIVTAPAHTFEAVPYLIEFQAITESPATAGASIILNLYDGATEAGRLGTITTPAAGTLRTVVHVQRRITPTAASHTYSIRAWRSAANGTIVAGAGTAGTDPAGFLRITRIPV